MNRLSHANRQVVGFLLLLPLGLIEQSFAQTAPTRTIPARTVPMPTTVSPELQKIIALPCKGKASPPPRTREEWDALIRSDDAGGDKAVDNLANKLHVTVQEGRLGGVTIYDVKPDSIADENRRRVLMHVHGGSYAFGGGKNAASEGVILAHYEKIEVVAVDYRRPPEFPFPAALDDSVAVWKELIKTHTPRNMGIFGTSAGGGLTLAIVIRLKELGLPLPGAIMAGTPWADLSASGDTYFTNQFVDNVLCTSNGVLEAAARLYAGIHDLKEPLVSPAFGDLSGFPPTVLLSGTRDQFLSDTVRVHQKLLQSGVEATLLVFEGQSHAQYAADVPESAVAYGEVSDFFNRHLDR